MNVLGVPLNKRYCVPCSSMGMGRAQQLSMGVVSHGGGHLPKHGRMGGGHERRG